MLSLVLTLALAQAPSVNFSADVYGVCPTTAELAVEVLAASDFYLNPGAFIFPAARAKRLSCLMATCEFQRAELEKEILSAPTPFKWYVLTGIGVAGIILGVVIDAVLLHFGAASTPAH